VTDANRDIAVEARNAVKAFGQGAAAVRALDDVSVQIRKGEFFTLLGPSGCGKTTLLRLIAGFETPTSGEIWLDGADITQLPPNQRPVNTVFQSYALFPHLTVAQNVGFGLEMLGRPKAEVAATTERMLALVKLEALAGRKTAQLSGGQQQRVALARALAPQPKVLLLDEPLSALDLKLRKEMQIELKRLQHETGITFIFVTHDQEEALTMSDRVGVMSAGKIQQIGSPRDIYTRPVNRFVASFIGETNFLPARIEDGVAVLATGDRVAVAVEGVQLADQGRKVTLAIRPEQIRLAEAGEPDTIRATIRDQVYFGTDTHAHLVLADGSEVVARLQSPASGDAGLKEGQIVGLRFAPGAAQVLGD
jgi:spermidine/putrescine transport system ATP-binding protein